MSKSGEKGIYEFDQFKLDAEKLMLYRDDSEMMLPPKVVKTLSVLVENRGVILSKKDLIDRVWQDAVVEESNLSQHLYLLRKTLGNKADGEPYIETLRRRGYRFTGQLDRGEQGAKTRMESRELELPEHQAAPLAVERHGNVLRLVDWNVADAPQKNVAIVNNEAPAIAGSHRVLALLAICFATLSIAGASIVIFWYPGTPAASFTTERNELSVSRLTNGGAPIDATISPNGDYFVYHELDGDLSRLWLQPVGQSNRIEIGTISDRLYSAKTFSPDGRYIYYLTSDKAGHDSVLYRVPSMGGPHAKLLTDVYGPVSFSPNGNEIVFLRFDKEMTKSTLMIADKNGRGERVVLDRTYPQRIVGPPSWSPDGKVIAFAEAELGEAKMGGSVAVLGVSPVDGQTRPLSNEKWDTFYRSVWTADGGGLLAIATRANDGRTPRRDQVYYISQPGGTSRRITNEGNRHYIWGLGVTRDDALIAVPFSRSSQIWSVDIDDATNATQISTGVGDGRAGLAPLPDGRIGYISRTGENLSVWIMNQDGSAAEQLTSEPPIVEELRADPQGRYFVFVAEESGRSHIFRIDVTGRNLRQLTSGDGNDDDSTISPDGNWIVYGSLVLKNGPPRSELWKISIEGGEPVKFSSEYCSSPAFSPDGLLVSCVRDEKEILVLSAADGTKLETYKLHQTVIVNVGVGWTPDGSGLTFIRGEKHSSNVWVQPRNGEAPRKLTNFTSGYLTRYAYSADGSRLFVARGYPIQDAILIKGFR